MRGDHPMITQYIFRLDTTAHPLYVDSAYRLYAHLLEQLPPEEAEWLHESGGRSISQYIRYDKEQGCAWVLNILCDAVAQMLRPVLDAMDTITIEQHTIPVTSRTVQNVTLQDLLNHGRTTTDRRTTLCFRTTTSFKQSGRYTIFPQERLILQSLMQRWNEVFPECSMADEDAFDALLAGLHIVDYRLASGRFAMKGVYIPGFTGTCVVEARLALPLMELWHTLLEFARYAGIGIKTGLGMGGTEVQYRK
jgi:CRISPR-associated endoribonuclease Cas6